MTNRKSRCRYLTKSWEKIEKKFCVLIIRQTELVTHGDNPKTFQKYPYQHTIFFQNFENISFFVNFHFFSSFWDIFLLFGHMYDSG